MSTTAHFIYKNSWEVHRHEEFWHINARALRRGETPPNLHENKKLIRSHWAKVFYRGEHSAENVTHWWK